MDKINFLQDTFLLAYKGLIDYTEPLRLMRSLVKTNTQQHIHWQTFEWHWSTLVSLVDYLPDTLPKFQVCKLFQIHVFLIRFSVSYRILPLNRFYPTVKRSIVFLH